MTATTSNRSDIGAWDQHRVPVISYLPPISKAGYITTCQAQSASIPSVLKSDSALRMQDSYSSNPDYSPKTQAIRKRNVNVPKFLRHLYEILENEDSSIIAWSHSGTAFQIKRPDLLAMHILPNYFKHRNVSSFQRQLNYFGFKKWTKTQTDVCTFSHPFFVRGDEDKLRSIRRKERKSMAHMYPHVSNHAADARMREHVSPRNISDSDTNCVFSQVEDPFQAKGLTHTLLRYKVTSPGYHTSFPRRYSDGATVKQLPSLKMREFGRADASPDSICGDLAQSRGMQTVQTSCGLLRHPFHHAQVNFRNGSPTSMQASSLHQHYQRPQATYEASHLPFNRTNSHPYILHNYGQGYEKHSRYSCGRNDCVSNQNILCRSQQ